MLFNPQIKYGYSLRLHQHTGTQGGNPRIKYGYSLNMCSKQNIGKVTLR